MFYKKSMILFMLICFCGTVALPMESRPKGDAVYDGVVGRMRLAGEKTVLLLQEALSFAAEALKANMIYPTSNANA